MITSLWRPTRRRLTDTLIAAAAPVAASSLALGALTTWVNTGNAGSPPRVEVVDGRVWLPYGDTRATSAYFRIINSGGADDRLLKVTSAAVAGTPELSRHRMLDGNAATGEEVSSIPAPAGDTLSMSPDSFNVTVLAKSGWEIGDEVPFTLHFEHEGRIRVSALVLRPGTDAS
ncbi:copper chaperone PCu(A)C [Streptomyces spinoverrucosus]|uniref:copper chaperone PCu(A)C n=1 Tax=Streptomyces spinoverrucosus TaxID=284043 RepID=UPI0018C360B4|nr:copper chaperone PCu(A)C [Streptomyces spinoverrucosus]MBG0851572.1 copper chaperone PCu(A)C [Streptomyces spinoverrucosus]